MLWILSLELCLPLKLMTLSIDSVSGTIEFGQTSGTVSLAGSVTSVNYNLLNTAANTNIIPTQYKWYYREKGVGDAEWEDVGSWMG